MTRCFTFWHYATWEFPKIRATFRTIVFGGLDWGPPILGNYHMFSMYVICAHMYLSAATSSELPHQGSLNTLDMLCALTALVFINPITPILVGRGPALESK